MADLRTGPSLGSFDDSKFAGGRATLQNPDRFTAIFVRPHELRILPCTEVYGLPGEHFVIAGEDAIEMNLAGVIRETIPIRLRSLAPREIRYENDHDVGDRSLFIENGCIEASRIPADLNFEN